MFDKLLLLSTDDMHPWGEPKILPVGAYDYILCGNPTQPDLYTFRFKLPPHYKIPPFKLSKMCCMTVLSGSLLIGEGTKIERNSSRLMREQSFVMIPAEKCLYFLTEEETILQFHGVGPIDFLSVS